MGDRNLFMMLRRDTVAQLAGLVYLTLVVLHAAAPGVGTPGDPRRLVGLLGGAVLVAMVVLGIQLGLRRSETTRGRRFWNGITVAVVLAVSARGLSAFWPAARTDVSLRLSFDALAACAAILFALAAVLRPDLDGTEAPEEDDERRGRSSAVLFILALWSYTAAIPAFQDPAAYLDGRLSIILDLCLIVFLLARFGHLSGATKVGRWSLVYRLILAAFVVAIAVEAIAFSQSAPAPYVGALGSLAAYLSLLLILAAARIGRYPTRVLPAAEGSQASRIWEPLAFYAIALPFLHILLDFSGQLSQRLQAVQEGFVLVYFIGFGTLALIQSARRESQRQVAERALRDSEHRYRQLIESYPDAILIEQDGALVYINTTGVDKFGLDLDGERHSFASLGFICPPELKERTAIPLECRVPGRDGEEMVLEISYYDIIYSGRPACQAIARDVTEARRVRAHSERTERLAWLGQFSAALAHEIRNPLAAIVMHGFFLSEQLADDEENLRTLADINTAVERMQKLVNGILAFVRPPTLRPEEEDLVALLDSARLELARRVSLDSIEVVEHLDHLAATVKVDVNQTVNTLAHVLDNAVRAMPGGGTLTLRTSNPSPDMIEIRIEDTGEGMSEEDLERAFEPFFARREDGVGLGLALVARVLDQHDGRYRLESRAGGGICFHLELPLIEPLDSAGRDVLSSP